jgi:hypothetical protein
MRSRVKMQTKNLAQIDLRENVASEPLAKPACPLAVKWWRRGELNPRPKSATPRSLHAYLSSMTAQPLRACRAFAFRAQNEQETQPASPMNLARTLRTEKFRPAHCVTPLTGPMSKARGSVRLIN